MRIRDEALIRHFLLASARGRWRGGEVKLVKKEKYILHVKILSAVLISMFGTNNCIEKTVSTSVKLAPERG